MKKIRPSDIVGAYRQLRTHYLTVKDERRFLKYGHIPSLTKTEMSEIKRTWPFGNLTDLDMTWIRIYKKFHGFSPYVIGVWQSVLLRKRLNPYEQLSSFENKGLCDIYFPDIYFPKPIVRRIAGLLYDNEMHVISLAEAESLLMREAGYIIKPSFGTMQGKGVQKITLESGQDDVNVVKIKQSFSQYNGDFIVQEIIRQHPSVAALNPTSLNSCRVTSLYINGKFDYSVMLKIGKKGSDVDNWNSSVLCGATKDGYLLDIAYDNRLNIVRETDNGIRFGGMRLPSFDEMIEYVEVHHKKLFPNCGMIGWDICVDGDGCIRVIEANLTSPGFVGEQLASGDFFRSFRDDICQIMRHN